MAMSDEERGYYAKAKAAGFPDELIAERIKARREETSPYKPTDYAAEASKLPSRAPEIEALMSKNGLSYDQAVDSLHHTDTLVAGRTPEQRSRDEDPYANDPMATMVLSGMLGAGAGSLVGGAARPILAGAANAATQSAVTGGDLKDIGTNALIGGAIPAVGRVGGAVARRIRGGEGGQARQLWEKHGGNVGPLDSGSGVEEIAGMEPTRNNVGRASAIGARNIRQGLTEDFDKNVATPFREAQQAVDYTPAGKEWTDVSSLIQTVGEVPEAIRHAIRRELHDLGAVMTPEGRVMMTQSDLNTARQRLQELANYGLNTGPGTGNIKDKSFKALANAAKVLVDEGPYAQANDIYERGINMNAVDRADIGLRKRPAKLEAGRATEDAKVAQILRNRSNDSEAAGAMAERADLPGFVSRHPELERQVDLPDLVRAKGTLQFGLDGSPTENLIQAARHRGVSGRMLELARHNAAAAAGRFAYRPAGLGLAAEDVLASPELNKVLAAYMAEQDLNKRRAEALGR